MKGHVFRDCINIPGHTLPGQGEERMEVKTIAFREAMRQGFEGQELHYLEHDGMAYCYTVDVEYGRGDPNDSFADRVLLTNTAALTEVGEIGTVIGDNLRSIVEEIHPGAPGGR